MRKAKTQKSFTVADYLLTRLKQLSVSEVFQIPGDYVKHFTQALEHFEGVQAIGTANELDAAYAADAYGRTRGLGAVSLQYGVSTYSALNAVAGAYVERSPMVVISAAPGADARRIGDMYGVLYHHSTGNLDADQAIFSHVTVATETLASSADAPDKIDRLLVAALTHQRPVYISCYKEVWGEPCPQPSRKKLRPERMTSEPAALENALDRVWTQIKSAKQPLIMAGVEVIRHGLGKDLQRLIEASGYLYTTTTLGKSVLPETGDKFIGTYSDQASVPEVLEIVQTADCIICLGTIITDDYLWLVENKFAEMTLITTEAARVGYFDFKGVALNDFMIGLESKFLADKSFPLKVKAPAQPRNPQPWLDNTDPKYSDQPDLITYNRFFEQTVKHLRKAKLLDKIVMNYGVSCSLYVASNIYGLGANGYLSSAAWQCIGWETGATSGAQLGSGKQAWTIAGDGGFMMIAQALSTLARYKINAVIFVMNNEVYAIEQVFVDLDSFQAGPQYKFDTFDLLAKWDYAAIAKAFGTNYHRAKTVKELKKVLKKITQPSDLPTLVEVVIPKKNLPGQMLRIGQE